MAINLRDVSDVDRRTARRLGLTPEKVNEVISVWAEEYLKIESEQARMQAAITPAPAPRKRAARSPRKAAARSAGTQTQAQDDQSPSDADVAATAGSPS